MGTFHAANKREVQSFPLATDQYVYAKYIKVSEPCSIASFTSTSCTTVARGGGWEMERRGTAGCGGGKGSGVGSTFVVCVHAEIKLQPVVKVT